KPALEVEPDLRDALSAVAVSVLFGAPLVALLALVVKGYGMSLFFGVPFLSGVVAGWIANRRAPGPLRRTLLVVLVSQMLLGGALLLFALAGGVCLAMAFPFSFLTGAMGGAFGREIALRTKTRLSPAAWMVVALPGLAAVEGHPPPPGGQQR